MQLKGVKHLKKILELCREQGVFELSVNGLSFKLGDLPQKTEQAPEQKSKKQPIVPTSEPTLDELVYFSAGGLPEDDILGGH